MRVWVFSLLMAVFVLGTARAGGENLFPNGDAESEWVNLVFKSEGYARHIQARDTGVPSFWRVTDGASLSRDERHGGRCAVSLRSAVKPVSAAVFSDYWRVKDGTMPFGAPILSGIPIDISFYYKTTDSLKEGAFSAKATLGVVGALDSEVLEIPLLPSTEWRKAAVAMTPSALRWGVQLVFTLNEGQDDGQTVWVDDVKATQDIGDRLNLVNNPGFEESPAQSGAVPSWTRPVEDQWVSWVGARYREPIVDTSSAASGWRSLRATVIYGEVSGISQEICLDQDRPRPVLIDLRSRLDNSVGSAPPGYYGPDNLPNLTVFIYHTDGTMQEVSPTFCLGESDHGWSYTRGGFMPQKPVERIRLQITLVGSECTTSLWVDDVSVFELGERDDSNESLPSTRLAPPRMVSAAWGAAASSPHGVAVSNDRDRLYLAIPRAENSQTTLVYLAPGAGAPFPDYHRYGYRVVRIGADGTCELGATVEKQGYTASGEFADAGAAGIVLKTDPDCYRLTVPFRAISLEGPAPESLGFNVQWDAPGGPRYWTGRGASVRQLGRLVTARPPGVSVDAVRFGDRWDREPDMSQDFVTHPQVNAGVNRAEVTLTNHGEATRVQWMAGVKGKTPADGACELGAGETRTIRFDYDAGRGGAEAAFNLVLRDAGTPGITSVSYPLEVPRAVEMVLDQEFYFPEEGSARLDVYTRLRPAPANGSLRVALTEADSSTVVWGITTPLVLPVTALNVPLDDARVNGLPVQDYEVRVDLLDAGGRVLAAARRPFGRIRHTEKRSLPPINKLTVDGEGRLIINDDFRYFPILPSLSSDDPLEAVQLGATAYRAYYRDDKTATKSGLDLFEAVDEAWKANAYMMTIGPAPSAMDHFEKEGPRLLAHPGFLGCYGMQFYYWNLPDEYVAYRRKLEALMGQAPVPKLVVWGHHDSSFLYNLGREDVYQSEAPLGYCYVKIMGRPGPAWRNAPFLTRTEEVLDPHKLKLAEVNYYVAWHDDEIVPEHFKTYRSLRADDWRGVRNESYLALIYGANGLYHYICVQKGGLQRLRGWFQELNYMWPVFVADDADKQIAISPADSGIEARLKKWNGAYYLLTANAWESPRSARITIEGLEGMHVRKLFNLPGAFNVDGNSIGDVWKQYDAFIYEITEHES